MKASLKCSDCGAEVSELKMSWGKKQYWFFLPILVVSFFPLIRLTFLKPDINKDLSLSQIRTEEVGSKIEVFGTLKNTSKRDWSSITIEVEFFDASGLLVDESTKNLQSDVLGHSIEQFKLTVHKPSNSTSTTTLNPVVKISGGYSRAF